MLKRIAVVAGLTFSVGGCSTLQSLGVSQATIDAIQQAAVSACGFLPTVETVIGIVSGTAFAVPEAAANAICQSVVQNQAPAGMQVGRLGAPAASGRAGAQAPLAAKVGSVQVTGVFVR